MRIEYGACALALIAACAGNAQSKAAQTANAAGGNAACDDYADRLCKELGPRSDPCRYARGIVPLFSPRACEAGIGDFDTTLARVQELRKACEAVAKRVCSEFGAESEACQAITHNLPDIPPGHCAGLLRDQDQLVAALRQREALQGPLSDERWQALLAGQPPGFGAPDAKVVIVEFSDFQCPYCAQAAQTVRRLREQYGERIRFVFRHFPLPFHPNARAAAQAAVAAQQQGKFWEYHDLLFGHQDALGTEDLLGYARSLGLDVEAFRAASQAEAASARVADDLRLGESVQIQGTPTMFIDKERLEDALDYDKVAQAIEARLERAGQ